MNSKHPRTDTKVAAMIASGQSADGLEFWARQLEEELADANGWRDSLRNALIKEQYRSDAAIASWYEERERALREAARVVVANKLLAEALGFVNPPLADAIADYLARTGAIKWL